MSLQTSHSRSTPLLWKSFNQLAIKGHRNQYEDNLISLLKDAIDEAVKVTIVADRGFSDVDRYDHITQLDFDYIIRTKSNIYVTDEKGNKHKTSELIPTNNRTKTLNNVLMTEEEYPVKRLILTKKAKMKEAWIIASSREDLSSSQIINLYSKRWGIETSFNDIKNDKFGMGMSAMHTKSTERRDRLFLISAMAIALLTLLGKAGDEIGLEKDIKANTSKSRTYSFWNQGCIYYNLLPKMKEESLIPLMEKFNYYLNNFRLFKRIFSVI